MKNIYLILILFLLSFTQESKAQLNVTYVSQLDYDISVNDIWGYVAPDGIEYALLGLQEGTAIISLADPANPVEVAYVPGDVSTWRDIKTWGDYAYVITDSSDDGLTIIDLTNLPNSVTTSYKFNFGSFGTLYSCHNIWMDEFGFAYVTGCNINNGGVVILDCFTNPLDPVAVGAGPAVYSHDVFARDNKMYTSEIYEGEFGIYDVADKSSIEILGTQGTASSFTHNTWLSEDNNVLFTTDEVGGAPVGAYDISDPENIEALDQFRPIETLGTTVVPHNVHVFQNWLIISYYTDGCIIVDATDPTNLIEVGNFDTYLAPGTGFGGAWGAYPFLPSGLVLVSDRASGLFVLEPDYVKACRLEGVVTDSITEIAINDVSVEIQATQANLGQTDPFGAYQSGIATAGTYDVIFSALEYYSKTISGVVLDNNVLTIQDAQLIKLPEVLVSGQVISAVTATPIEGAEVFISNASFNYSTITDASGMYELPAVFIGDYEMQVGEWGYHSQILSESVMVGLNEFNIELVDGYKDEFFMELGWTTSGTATNGQWERGIPIGTTYQSRLANVDSDVQSDLGEQCYVTGIGPQFWNSVSNGNVVLTSPSMDLTTYTNPVISCYAYFFNESWTLFADEFMTISINNGSSTVLLEVIDATTNGWTNPLYYNLVDYIDITDNMTFIVETEDEEGSSAVVEAALDLFEVHEGVTYTDFSASNTGGCWPLEVDFTDEGSDATSWLWTFEGGEPSTSTEQNPTVVFTDPGVYSVFLTVTLDSGVGLTSQTDLIEVNEAPTSDFTYDQLDETISFVNNSSDNGTYFWDFGDGNTSTEENPSHIFENGVWTVSLVVQNECGVSQSIETVVVNVSSLLDVYSNVHLNAYPNPFTEVLQVHFELPSGVSAGTLVVYDLLGRQLVVKGINQHAGIITLEEDLKSGVYLIEILCESAVTRPLRVVKQ